MEVQHKAELEKVIAEKDCIIQQLQGETERLSQEVAGGLERERALEADKKALESKVKGFEARVKGLLKDLATANAAIFDVKAEAKANLARAQVEAENREKELMKKLDMQKLATQQAKLLGDSLVEEEKAKSAKVSAALEAEIARLLAELAKAKAAQSPPPPPKPDNRLAKLQEAMLKAAAEYEDRIAKLKAQLMDETMKRQAGDRRVKDLEVQISRMQRKLDAVPAVVNAAKRRYEEYQYALPDMQREIEISTTLAAELRDRSVDLVSLPAIYRAHNLEPFLREKICEAVNSYDEVMRQMTSSISRVLTKAQEKALQIAVPDLTF